MRKQIGISLLELTVVVAILGIIALVVVPEVSSTDPYKLDLAAEQVAQAIRFARSEAMRTGKHHGVTISQVTQEITVKQWDITTNPVSTKSIPYDPLRKQTFNFDVSELTLAPGVHISNSSDIFLYDGVGRRRSLIFDPLGLPVWIIGSDDSIYRLEEGIVQLSAGQGQRSISVAPITGRVTIQ